MKKLTWTQTLIIILVAYAIIATLVSLNIDLTISNSYQRTVTSAFISELRPTDFSGGLSGIKQTFLNGHEHYKIFSGISDWQPLQMLMMALTFFIFGIGKTGFILFPLATSLITLVYIYLTTKKISPTKYSEHAGIAAVVLVAVSTFFFYEAAVPMLENGVLLFSLMAMYHFAEYLEKKDKNQLYLAALGLSLGMLLKSQILLVLPSLLVAFLLRVKLVEYFTSKKNLKHLAIAAIICLIVLIPLIISEALLATQGLSQTYDRNIGRLDSIAPKTFDGPGVLFADDLEFSNSLPAFKKDLIMHRYEIPAYKKAIVLFSSVFYNWAIIPLMIIGLFMFRRFKHKRLESYDTLEMMLITFLLVNIVFFSLHGMIPRHVLMVTGVAIIFSAKGFSLLLSKEKESLRKLSYALLAFAIILTTLQTIIFVVKAAEGLHVQSMQHDYGAAAKYVLEHQDGDFTIITTRVYQMAFHILEKDEGMRVYVEQMPEKKLILDKMMAGNFSLPPLISERSDLGYSTQRPKVAFVILHEGLETGPLAGIADFNIKEYLDSRSDLALEKVIPSKFPNSDTYIYRVTRK